jgi:hypothetical protein
MHGYTQIYVYSYILLGILKFALGYYIEKVQKLYEENKISTGKYESYLLDAFREDIVFGLESSEEEYVD